MALTWSIGPEPIWYFVDQTGKPLAGGSFQTFRSLNKQQQKAVFQDPAGQFPWPNPALINENGTLGPFWWQVDSSNLQETYYIEVYDANGNLIWTQDDYLPSGGAGGGDVTEGVDLTNLIVNNTFYRHGPNSANPIGVTQYFLAPGAHSGFASSMQPGNQPDIQFFKNNTAATDQLSFVNFNPGDLGAEDTTPPQFLRYVCTGSGAGETAKYVQYPISVDIQSTSNQTAVVGIWARCNSGNANLSLYFYQFYGDGAGASMISPVIITTLTLTTSWKYYSVVTTIPNITGNTYGACQNSGLFLQVAYPLSATTSIDHVKPSVWLGSIVPDTDYLTNDQIDAVINAPRTGDVRVSLNSFAPYGWVLCNDGTIGNPNSGATRANFDTFPLFDCLWNQVTSQTNGTNVGGTGYAQLYDSAGNPIGSVGASSMADYAANRRVGLTKILGRALASAGAGSGLTAFALGQFVGANSYSLQLNDMPQHVHVGQGGASFMMDSPGNWTRPAPTGQMTDATTTGGISGYSSQTPISLMQPTSFFNVFLKL